MTDSQPWPDRENRDPRRGGRDAPSDKLRVVHAGWSPDEILRTLGATGADLEVYGVQDADGLTWPVAAVIVPPRTDDLPPHVLEDIAAWFDACAEHQRRRAAEALDRLTRSVTDPEPDDD